MYRDREDKYLDSILDEPYWCNHCKSIVSVREVYDDETGYRELFCCECGDDYVSEAVKCPICDDYIDPDTTLCESCKCDVDDVINDAISRVRRLNENMTTFEARDIFLTEFEDKDF